MIITNKPHLVRFLYVRFCCIYFLLIHPYHLQGLKKKKKKKQQRAVFTKWLKVSQVLFGVASVHYTIFSKKLASLYNSIKSKILFILIYDTVVQNCDQLDANATENWMLATRILRLTVIRWLPCSSITTCFMCGFGRLCTHGMYWRKWF